MIKIDKSNAAIPAILAEGGKGFSEIIHLKAKFEAGELDFKFNKKIYGDKSVKETLKAIQHDKCCFCEARVTHVSHGDIEHFRPKAGYKSRSKDRLTKPGYYWLAYDFSNLFFSCQLCNQKYKKWYFPIVDETRRAASHLHDWRDEESLILHPEFDDPEQHITFVAEVVKPKGESVKGDETIKRTGIDRRKLTDSRFDYLLLLRGLAALAKSDLPESEEAKVLFKDLGKSTAQYSSMVRSNFPDLV